MRPRAIAVIYAMAGFAGVAAAQPAPQRGADPPLLSTTPTPTGERADPSQMSGLPLQVGDLPPGTVAVRLVRGGFANNIVNQPVELQVTEGNRRTLQSTTDPAGRAVFSGLQVGEVVMARSLVDGELLQSQIFQLPAQGGVRVALVAGIGAGGRPSTSPDAPAAGRVDVRPWWAASVVLAALGIGVWMLGLRSYRRGRREALFQALIQLEDARAAGHVDDAQYQARHAALVDRVVEIDARGRA